MPHIMITIGKTATPEQKDALQAEIGGFMETIPGKNIGNTIINIVDGSFIYNNGARVEAAFADVRLFQASPEDAKAAFCEKLYAAIEKNIGIPYNRVTVNFLELEHWGGGGGYR